MSALGRFEQKPTEETKASPFPLLTLLFKSENVRSCRSKMERVGLSLKKQG